MDLSRMFFQDWSGLLRTVVVGGLAYVALTQVAGYAQHTPGPRR